MNDILLVFSFVPSWWSLPCVCYCETKGLGDQKKVELEMPKLQKYSGRIFLW